MAYKEKYNSEDGVWRTIGGRKVFIKKGQSVAEAMIESGKFKGQKNKPGARESYRQAIEEKNKSAKDLDNELREKEDKYLSSDKGASEQEKERKEIKELHDRLKEKAKEEGIDTEKTNWRDEINANKQKENSPFYERLDNQGKEEYDNYLKKGYSKSDIENTLMYDTREKELHKVIGNTEGREDLQKKANDFVTGLAKSNSDEQERLELARELTKELYQMNDKNSSQEKIDKKARELMEVPEGTITSDLQDWEWDKNTGQWTKESLQERLAYVTKGYDESRKLGEQFKKEYEEKNKPKSTDETMNDTIREKASENFVQENTQHGGTREYTPEEVEQMAEKGIKPMKSSYSGYGWEGVNARKNLSTSEQAKEITNAMKEKYPDVKIARKSQVYSGGSSIDFNIMSSDKDLYISDKDIDNFGSKEMDELTRGWGFERWANDNVPNYRENHTYNSNDVKRYAKEDLNNMRKRDNQNVSGNEWFLSDYGKKVVSELNKQANSYTYDDSDGQIDYFNHGTYMDISIGKWNKPYSVNEKSTPKTTNETMNNAIREKASKKSNTIPRDYEKITYTSKIDTNAGKSGDKFELYKNEYGDTITKNLRTGETFTANMSMLRTPEAVEINDIIRKQANVKNEWKQYLKDHPESNMSLSKFKNMKK